MPYRARSAPRTERYGRRAFVSPGGGGYGMACRVGNRLLSRNGWLALGGLLPLLLVGEDVVRPRDPSNNASDSQASASPAASGLDQLQMPLHFEPNTGQTDESVHYLARGAGYTLFL